MTDLYKPPGSLFAHELPESQIRLGIQGAPFTGKTWASLTFPNPVILSLDRKVSAHAPKDAIIIPFHDVRFIDSLVRRAGTQAPPSTKEAITRWLTTEGVKLSNQQTLILDGSTSIEEAFHIWYNFNETELASTKSGEIDGFVQWNLKKSYWGELFACMKAIPGNVIYIVHEGERSDKNGVATGKLYPLLTGQVGNKLAGNFTDWFRTTVISKPKDKDEAKKLRDWAGIDEQTLQEWIESTPKEYQSIHLWQTQGDSVCDCGTSTLTNCPKFILADYKSFSKYRKTNEIKQTNTTTNE